VVIWVVLAIVVIVIGVSSLLGGRRYQTQRRSGSRASGSRQKTHHGKGARNHRGRGRAH
jgi:hypothetical protein